MSIGLVVTRGYSNGTQTGTIKDVVTRGYTISDIVTTPDLAFGVFAIINENGEGVEGLIVEAGIGVLGDL